MIIQKTIKKSALFALLISTLFAVGCSTITTRGDLGDRNPNDARDAYIQLGVEYLRVDDRENAKSRFLRAIEIDEDAAGAYTGLAIIYERSKEYDEAERFFKRAIRADDSFTSAKIQYGLFLLNLDRLDDACDTLEEARDDVLSPQRHIALRYLGRCYYQQGEYEDAIRELSLATRVNRRETQSYLELTRVYLDANQIVEAKSTIDTYVRVGQESAESLYLALMVERAFRNQDAEETLAQQLRLRYPYSQEWQDYQELVAND